MFDIGFAELLLVSIIGLLVLGPERLPGAIRTLSLWLGRLRRSFNSLRMEIEREINADEIKRDIHNDAVMQSLKAVEDDLKSALPTDTPYDISGITESKASATENKASANDSKPGDSKPGDSKPGDSKPGGTKTNP